jgi:PAS domain S-box-containing protein
MVTGHASVGSAVKALSEGASGYVTKPVNVAELLAVVGEAVEKQRLTEQKQKAEEALRESEERFRQFFENIPDYGYRVSPEGVILDVNDAACRALGYGKEELVGRQVRSIYAPESQARVGQLLKGCQNLGRLIDEELVLLTREGERRTVLLGADDVRDSEGRLLHRVSVQKDITERMQAEEKLRESEERFSKAFQANPIITTITSLTDGRLIDVNEACVRLTGYSRDEIIGRSALELDIYGDPAERAETFRLMSEEGEVYDLEIKVRTKSGDVLDVMVSSVAIEIGGEPCVLVAGYDITERRRAEEETAESERNLRRAQEVAHIGSWTWHTGTNEMAMSDELFNILGLNKDEGVPPVDVEGTTIHPEDRERLRENITRCREERVPYSLDYRIYRQNDGELRHLHLETEVEQLPGSEDILIHGTVQDITERNRAEEALRASETKFRLLAESMPAAVIMLRGQELVYANPFTTTLTGYGPNEIRATPFWELVHPDHREIVRHRAEARLSGEDVPDRYQMKVLTKSGGAKWVDLAAVLSEYEGGPAILATVLDITEQKRAEMERDNLLAQIERQAERVEHIIRTVPEGVLLLDKDLKVVVANPIARGYLGGLTASGVGDLLNDLGGRPIAEFLTSPPPGLWHEVSLDGASPRTFEVKSRPIENGPETSGWVLAVRDVTQEREIERRTQQQERLAAVGQLAAGIAHDFNNVMATIMIYAGMLEGTEGLSQRDRERVTVVGQQARHATELINQILDFSGRAVLERRQIDLLPLVTEQVALLRRTLPEHIGIELHHGPGGCTVNADGTRIRQMLTNLAVNARDAMPGGGRLRIGLERITTEPEVSPPQPGMKAGEWIRLSVSDTGTGIPTEALPHIFEPFFTTKGPGEGSGLGLAQVHGIVGQHGGHIGVDTRVGEGTTFAIYLPVVHTGPPKAFGVEVSTIPNGCAEAVLVVEDGDALREALVASLGRLNYRALQAANGREALALVEEHGDEIALVLSDVVMPEMGGVALLQALRQRRWLKPVILLTGHPMGEELDELRTQGLCAWLPKPPDLEDLAQAMARALRDCGGRDPDAPAGSPLKHGSRHGT